MVVTIRKSTRRLGRSTGTGGSASKSKAPMRSRSPISTDPADPATVVPIGSVSDIDTVDSPHSPFFLHSADHPGLSLVADRLDGLNYNHWCSAMKIALDAKNKLAFIDGSLPRPEAEMKGMRLGVIVLLLLHSIFYVAFCFKDGLLPNGDFELGPQHSDMKGTQVINKKSIPNWELSGFVEYIPSGHKQGDMILVVPKGAFAVRLGNEASIKQKINVKKGSYYSITFSAARTCAQDEKLNVSVAPHHAVMPIQTVYSSSGWDLYSWAFKAQSENAEIVIHNPGVEEDPACGPLIDGVAMRALFPPRPTNKNILKNGGFEEGPWVLPNTSSGVLIPPNSIDDHSPLPGWMVESLKAVKYIDSDHFSVPQGHRAVELVAGKESAIAQVVRTIPGKIYVLSFAVGDASNACAGSMIVEAFAGQDTIKVPYESKGKGGFKRSSLRFVAVSDRTRVMFYSTFYAMRNDDFSSLCGPVIDDVKLLSARRP